MLREPKRVFLFHLDAWDVNCPQHITRRFAEEDIGPRMRELRDRVTELETELRDLRRRGD